MPYIPYTQTHDYFETKVQEGHELVELGSAQQTRKLVLIKEPIILKNIRLPLFYKLRSDGLDLEDYARCSDVLDGLAALVKRVRCARALIVANPVEKRERFPQFKNTLYTYLLDLEKNEIVDEDDYLASLNPKVRNQVRRANKQQLEFLELEVENGLADYVRLRQKCRSENGLAPLEHGLLEMQLRGMPNSVRIFLVKKDGQALCGQIVQHGVNVFTLVGVCTSKIAYENKLNVNELMQHKIVNLAIKEGVKFVDWVGANPASKDSKLIAIDKFKRKWGGELTELPCILKGYSR